MRIPTADPQSIRRVTDAKRILNLSYRDRRETETDPTNTTARLELCAGSAEDMDEEALRAEALGVRRRKAVNYSLDNYNDEPEQPPPVKRPRGGGRGVGRGGGGAAGRGRGGARG